VTNPMRARHLEDQDQAVLKDNRYIVNGKKIWT
jgi:hypothetical protein